MRKKWIAHIDKCRYKIQKQKDVPVQYTGIYMPISSTACHHQNLKLHKVEMYFN